MGGRPLIAWFLIFEVALFALASLTHGGRLIPGYEHLQASIAEAVIAGVLAVGFIAFLALPRFARRTALAVQILPLLGVMAGLLAIAMGVGPQTTTDLILHGVMVITLLLGFILTLRSQ